MRHATQATLDQIDGLLEAIRLRTGLVERRRGIFYRRSKSFPHFMRIRPASSPTFAPATTSRVSR